MWLATGSEDRTVKLWALQVYSGIARERPSCASPSPLRWMTGIEKRISTMAAKKTNESISRKKAYQKPTLTRYGQLKDLTTGGSGNAQESSSGKKPRP
jgi:hypothetical protein